MYSTKLCSLCVFRIYISFRYFLCSVYIHIIVTRSHCKRHLGEKIVQLSSTCIKFQYLLVLATQTWSLCRKELVCMFLSMNIELTSDSVKLNISIQFGFEKRDSGLGLTLFLRKVSTVIKIIGFPRKV